MRMYDRCLQMAPLKNREQMRAEAHETTVVDISVAAEYFADSQNDTWTSDDYMFARPPWETTFLEWKWADNTPTIGKPGQVAPKAKGEGAIYCKASEITDDLRALIKLRIMTDGLLQDRDHDDAVLAADTATVQMTAMPYLYTGGQLKTLPVFCCALLRADGFVMYSSLHVWNEAEIQRWELPPDRVACLGMPWLLVSWLGFSFMNCRQGGLIETTEADQPPAKIRRRLNLPDVRRHTLTVKGYERPKVIGSDGGDVVPRPLHWVRGHFAKFTEERPAFGRPGAVGNWWIPPHTRGKREQGLVMKDYRLGKREAS